MRVLTRLLASVAASVFGFFSGVVRNARTFHPDGRVFRATVRSLAPSDPALEQAAKRLEGSALMRVGMGVIKRGMPASLADRIPDAPSIATRFYSPTTADELRLERRAGHDLDLLCTAGGDRLSKLVWNLATGGRRYGLDRFDYFANLYYAQVPYRIDGTGLDVWLRLAPVASSTPPARDGRSREDALTSAASGHAVVRIEMQRAGDRSEPFVPVAEIRFDQEVEVDQEALHFDALAGRGFEPHGIYTELRRAVYPASARRRPPNREERVARDRQGFAKRLARYLKGQ